MAGGLFLVVGGVFSVTGGLLPKPPEHKIGIFVLEQKDKWHREA